MLSYTGTRRVRFCAECGYTFATNQQWEDRHTRADGEDVHAHCCPECKAAGVGEPAAIPDRRHDLQPTLFDGTSTRPIVDHPSPLVGADATDTQQAAAAMQTPDRLSHLQQLVLATLGNHPEGLTDFELAARTGTYKPTIGKRRTELAAAGLVEDSGERRPTTTGASAIVWRLRR